ncbi:NADH dehydrogenase subunit J [Bacteroidota bacterium]|nr:NADH dehydrogenase subunit J [Bacteroidota bacterium]
MLQSLFYFLSFAAIFCAVMVVISKNPVHSVMYLILTFFCIAGHYLLLNAQFLAIVHLIVYAGAIMVLFLFVIMLLNLNQDSVPKGSYLLPFAGALSGGTLLLVLVSALKRSDTLIQQSAADASLGMLKTLGKVLYTDYVLPFEIASVLFLIAMVGSVILSKKDPLKEPETV